MNNRERIVIYAALALLAVWNVAAMSDDRGSTALAQGTADGTQLGPAGTLALSGETDDPLVLRNADGRLAWSDSEYSRAYSVAFMHVGKAMGPLLEAEQYVEEYQELEAELRARDEELFEQMEAFREEHKDITPDDPRAAEIQQAFQAMLQQREQMRLAATQRLGLLASEHIERAYRDMVAAVDVVAARRGIDIVYRFIPTENDFNAINPNQSYTGIRARIALKYPAGLDITDEVLEELAVEVP